MEQETQAKSTEQANNDSNQNSNEVKPKQPPTKEQISTFYAQATTYHKMYNEFMDNFEQEEEKYYYLISTKWIERWKVYVSYPKAIQNQEPDIFCGGPVPGKINEDIINEDNTHYLMNYLPHSFYLNQKIKPGLELNKDFIFVNQKIWEFFQSSGYAGHPIIRASQKFEQSGKKINFNLHQVTVILVSHDILYDIDCRQGKFTPGTMLLDPFMTIEEFYMIWAQTLHPKYKSLSSTVSSNFYSTYEKQPEKVDDFRKKIRIFKLDNKHTPVSFYSYVYKICRQTRGVEYFIPLEGAFLETKNPSLTKLEDYDIAPNDILVIEVKNTKKFEITHPAFPIEGKCESCSQYGVLLSACICKKVFYCNEQCRKKDYPYHSNTCEKSGLEEEEDTLKLVETPSSVLGRCGLRNLGNTCFMNSGLQCMTNITELTQYFLSNQYKNDVNHANPIGMKGELAISYSILVKKMWFGSEDTQIPSQFKKVMGKVQSIFLGYNQNDSQELLSFALDGLHEDLNLVLKKPNIQQKDYDGKVDLLVAEEHWGNFLSRNRSIIVDLMFGQFRSKLHCPKCNKISIQFDPYQMISLPIPIEAQKYFEYTYVDINQKEQLTKHKYHFDKSKQPTVAKFKEALSQQFQQKDFTIVVSYSYGIDLSAQDSTLLQELKKKGKYRTILVRPLFQRELDIPPESRQLVQISYTYTYSSYYGSSFRNEFGCQHQMYFNSNDSMKQIHMFLFQRFRYFFEDKIDATKSDEENYQQIFLQSQKKPWELNFITNSKGYWTDCYFCDHASCKNCPVPFDDAVKLGDIVEKINKKKEKTSAVYTLAFEIFWIDVTGCTSMKELFKTVDVAFNDPSSTTLSQNKVSLQGKDSVTLQKCIEAFREPETLLPDNAWYCAQCKEHVLAEKQMEIYKAPQILIFHLKRFKNSHSIYYKKKQSALVHFELEGLDLSKCVMNPNLPVDYPEELKNPKLASQQGKLIYDLFAVSNHYGSLGGGHYTAYVKNSRSQKWFYCDDSSVREETNLSSIISEAAYVLFYRRRGVEGVRRNDPLLLSVGMQQNGKTEDEKKMEIEASIVNKQSNKK